MRDAATDAHGARCTVQSGFGRSRDLREPTLLAPEAGVDDGRARRAGGGYRAAASYLPHATMLIPNRMVNRERKVNVGRRRGRGNLSAARIG